MSSKILVTVGPSSLKQEVISDIDQESIFLFRINLSHTSIEDLPGVITQLQKYTDTPICLDSEGAQIRNQKMAGGEVVFTKNDSVRIHFKEVVGDTNNISFTPGYVARDFKINDVISIDFNSVKMEVIEKKSDHLIAIVINGGKVGSNKATNLNHIVDLEPITEKDKKAIEIGREMGIKHFALSFSGSAQNVLEMRELTGEDAFIISKVESLKGLQNLDGVIKESDAILIDRGDLSREVLPEKIPFLQRQIIAASKALNIPVFVATNLLESMMTSEEPTRAETNDVVSTILMGADGLVLAAETAVGKYPVEAVKMIRKLLNQLETWTPNSSIQDILNSSPRK